MKVVIHKEEDGTRFVRIDKVKYYLTRFKPINLTDADYEAFINALDNPPAPSPELRSLINKTKVTEKSTNAEKIK